METATAELPPDPTFVAPQGPASQITSILSRAPSEPSPPANIAESSAGATSKVSSYARGPLINDEAANTIIGITCMLLVLCIAAVVGRILARRNLKLRIEADDYLALVALVSSIPVFLECSTH